MFKVTWVDEQGKRNTIALSSIRSAQLTIRTLRMEPDKYSDIRLWGFDSHTFSPVHIKFGEVDR